MNLSEALPIEQARVRELIEIYKEHCGIGGAYAVALMQSALNSTERAIAAGDTVKMLACYQELQSFKE
jgi:hypothetical protein